MATPGDSLAPQEATWPWQRPRRAAGTGSDRTAAARRADRLVWKSLRPGVAIAVAFATALAFARWIDVTDTGPAMILFASTFGPLVAIAAFMRPSWYTPLVVAYLPFARVYPLPVAGVTGANLTNLMLLAGLASWANRANRGEVTRFGATEKLVLVYLGLGTLSLYQSWSGGFGLGEIISDYREWLAPAMFFFIARGAVKRRAEVAAILIVIAYTTTLVSGLTWLEGIDRGGRSTIEASRVRGLMEGSNLIGAFLVYYGVPMFAYALVGRSLRARMLHLAGFAISARALLFTFSRSAYLAMAAGVAVVTFLRSRVLFVWLGISGLVAVSAFPGLLPSSVRDRLAATFDEQAVVRGQNPETSLDKSSAHRLVIWEGAGRMISERPLQGFGLGRFQYVIGRYTSVPLKPHDPTDAHNAFLLVAAELGVPALLVLLLVFLAIGESARRLFFRSRAVTDRRVALGMIGTLVGLAISCMLGSRFSDESLTAYFWVTSALILVLRQPSLRRRRRVAA